ncbi:hypothetical protein LRH25_09025 [Ideonella azotifigens]|uniref:winged helix-turn-helix domain-containing protein n=1 Tax=Ideonella azotifigens TaxID=513160 RepID=UPI001476D0D1|nr:hypothetical protein [Ideonella azotifigens]MCD2340485.1 hypothetical protein [Ideonella azotifigens]
MKLQATTDVIHCYQGWELRVDEHQLLVQGKPVKIGRSAFMLLLALIEGRGSVVRKDELIAAAWPGRRNARWPPPCRRPRPLSPRPRPF